MDMIEFVKNNWLFILIAALIIIFLIRAMFKLALIALVIGAVLVFGFGFTPNEVVDIGKNVAGKADELYAATIEPLLEKELKNAETQINEDGSFVIRTKSVKILGTEKSKVVTVIYKDKRFDMKVADMGTAIRSHIEKLQSSPTK